MTTSTLGTKTIAAVGSVAMLAAMMVPSLAAAATLDAFTQTELDTNWVTDRQFPSGGVNSVSAYGRDDVAAIGVVGAEQSTSGSFYYYEGIKKEADLGDTVEVDLYVPEEWQEASTSPQNVGMWIADDPISAYPLIVFRNGEEVDAGFYIYNYEFDEFGDPEAGIYVPSEVGVNYGGWNTLSIALDTDTDVASYTINGEAAGEMNYPVTGDNIGQVFLNHYNDGEFDYTAHWHAGISDPTTKQECMNDGWMDFGFKNQGKCIQFVNTGKDSR